MRSFFLLSLLLTGAFAWAQQTNQIDAKGRKQGKWIKYDENNNLAYIGSFKDDLPQGTFRYYYPYKDTVLRSLMEFKKGGKEAYAINFHLNGKLMAKGRYINQKKDSLWHFYDEEGFTISSDLFKDDKKNGISKVFYPDGKLYSETMYKNDIKEGAIKEYFPDGTTKMEGAYWQDKPHGKFVYYYPSGKVAASGIYRNGLKHLIWNYTDVKGKPEPREVYNLGKQLEGKAADDFLKTQKAEPNNTNNTPKTGTKNSGSTKPKTTTTTTKPKTGTKPAGQK